MAHSITGVAVQGLLEVWIKPIGNEDRNVVRLILDQQIIKMIGKYL